MGLRISTPSTLDNGGIAPAAIRAEKSVALGVEPRNFFGTSKKRKVVAPFAIFRLVIDDTAFNFDFADAEIALEVGGIVLRIPEAKLNCSEDRKVCGTLAMICNRELPDLKIFVERNEVPGTRLYASRARANDRVAQAMATEVILELSLSGLPGRRPEFAGIIVTDIDIAPAEIARGVVVAVAGNSPQARVTIEGISAGGIGDDAEISLAAQIVDPRQRRVRLRDYVLTMLLVEVSVIHAGRLLRSDSMVSRHRLV